MPRRLRFIPDNFRIPVAEIDEAALALSGLVAAVAAFGAASVIEPLTPRSRASKVVSSKAGIAPASKAKASVPKKRGLGIVVFEVTLKTMGDRFFIRPDKAVLSLIYGVLGRALKNTGVLHFANSVMSNHLSMLVGVRSINHLGSFMRQFGGGTSLRVRRYLGLATRLWARRNQSIVVAPDGATLLDRMGYVFANGTKEGLVSHPSKWPGGNSARYFCNGEIQEGIFTCLTTYHAALKRDANARIEDHQTHYVIPHHRLPGFEHLKPEDYRKLMQGLCDDRAVEAALKRSPDAAPHPEPESLTTVHRETCPDDPKRSPAPRCHASSNVVKAQFQKDYLAYVDRHRSARADLLASLHATAGTFDEGIEPTGCRELDPELFIHCEPLSPGNTGIVQMT